jgi:poly(hydroxyalkanoate) depolymerase family esterase
MRIKYLLSRFGTKKDKHMHDGYQPGMAEATRLVQAGRLGEATALIQRLLRGEGQGADRHGPGPATLDLEATSAELRDLDGEAPKAKPQPRPQPQPQPRPRQGLGDTIRDIVSAKLRRARHERAPEPVPAGARFERASHTEAAGTRAYWLYVPSAASAGNALPLVVMLHGCTQSPEDFAAGTRMNAVAEEMGFLVAYPAQDSSANGQRCWNWFTPEDQRRDRGEASLIAGITRRVMREHTVDPRRVYVAGLSAGGAAAANLAGAYPDLFAAAGVHSGLPAGAARDLPSAFAAMRGGAGGAPFARPVPTIVFHGDKDSTVHPRNAEAVVAQALAGAVGVRTAVQGGRAQGGHGYSRAVHADEAGRVMAEMWTIHGAGHAWAGGSPAGSYTDARGPDAAREMARFFLEHPSPAA